ncbi:MAG: PorT family protein [Bacteroidaceae bacterium]|nr:PorT family protein [Bacteroidaceae bacterium]
MKQRLFIVILIIACGTLLSLSQQRDPNFPKELSLGVKAGVNFPNMALSPSVQQNTWIGYTAGFTMRYIEEKLFGFVIEANFSQRGWDEKFETDPYNYRRTFNYVEIPFMSHIYFGSDKFHAFVNLGPQLGIMLNDTYTANFDVNNPPSFSERNKIKESYSLPVKNIFDYGITGGVGVELRMQRHIVALEGRYYFGLGDTFGNHKSDVFYGSSANRGFTITLSYMFRIW